MIAHILLHGISILGRSACGRSGEDTQTSIYQAREAGEWWTKLRYATLTSQFLIVCNDVFAVVLSQALAEYWSGYELRHCKDRSNQVPWNFLTLICSYP